jgi:hypothetical protein
MLVLFSYQGSTQRRVNSLLLRCSDVASNVELMFENHEEGCDAEDNIVATETQTSKRMSLAFSHNEDILHV